MLAAMNVICLLPTMTDTIKLNLGKISGAIAAITFACGMVWTAAVKAEQVDRLQSEVAASKVEVRELRDTLQDMREALGRIEEKLNALKESRPRLNQ